MSIHRKKNPHGGTHRDLICFVCKKGLTDQMDLTSVAHLYFDYDIDKWVVICTNECNDNKELYSERIDRLIELKELRDGKKLKVRDNKMSIEDFCIICNHYHPDKEIAIDSDTETIYALNKADCDECDCDAESFESEDVD